MSIFIHCGSGTQSSSSERKFKSHNFVLGLFVVLSELLICSNSFEAGIANAISSFK